jgi:nucleotide-binding universal stress UspA family protein
VAIKDILLSMNSHPDRTPDAAIGFAVRLAKLLDAQLSAVIWELRLQRPGAFHFVADALLDLPTLLDTEMKKSAANAQHLAAVFGKSARDAGAAGHCEVVACAPAEVPDRLAERARLHDLTMVPMLSDDEVGALHAETAIFGSGRPVLLVPEAAFAREAALSRVAVAWDFSAPAARAVADALPLIERADEVRIVTIANEKPLKSLGGGEALSRHLAAHGVKTKVETVEAAGRPAGDVLQDYMRSAKVDLLVMGAFGHSRLQQFVLGGATRTVLHAPAAPVLLSH